MKETEAPQSNAAFLNDLIAGMAPAAPSLPAAAAPAGRVTTTERAAPRPRARPAARSGVYDRALQTIAHLGAIAGAGLLWWIGAQFTLQFLISLGVNLTPLGLGQWLIPLTITGIELSFWPKEGANRNLVALFMIVAGLDLITSCLGLIDLIVGRNIPRLGITIQENVVVWAAAFVVAAACAFWPEKLARAGWVELRTLWKF